MFDFTNPSRQSIKGIAVLFGFNSYKVIKRLLIAIAAFSYSLIKSGKIFGMTQNKITLLVFCVFLIIFIRSFLQYLNFKFYIDNEDFILSKGILNKEKISVSKSKIQNIYIKQNVLQQIINIVQLEIETAGDAKAEVKISALNRERALALKEQLLSNITIENKDSELLVETPKIATVYYKASVKKLFLEGLSQNHIRSFMIIVGFVGGFYNTYEDYLKKLKLGDKFDLLVKQNESSIGVLVVIGIVVLSVILIISILFSLIKTFLLNFELQVVEHKKTIEIKKGLFNKVAIILSPSRIQNIEIENNRLKRYFGLSTLSIKQAMVDKKLQKHFSIIGLDRTQLNYLVKKLMQKCDVISKDEKPEKYFIRIMLLKSIVPLVFFNFISFLNFENQFWIINLFLIPLILVLIYWRYKKAYYHLKENMLIVGSGAISTITQLLELHKIQAVATKQTIFQKIRKITTVEVYTASKATKILHIKEEKANVIVNFLLYQVESQRKNWM